MISSGIPLFVSVKEIFGKMNDDGLLG